MALSLAQLWPSTPDDTIWLHAGSRDPENTIHDFCKATRASVAPSARIATRRREANEPAVAKRVADDRRHPRTLTQKSWRLAFVRTCRTTAQRKSPAMMTADPLRIEAVTALRVTVKSRKRFLEGWMTGRLCLLEIWRRLWKGTF